MSSFYFSDGILRAYVTLYRAVEGVRGVLQNRVLLLSTNSVKIKLTKHSQRDTSGILRAHLTLDVNRFLIFTKGNHNNQNSNGNIPIKLAYAITLKKLSIDLVTVVVESVVQINRERSQGHSSLC